MDLNHFPNVSCSSSHGCKGIIVNNAQVRAIPTDQPFYHDFTTAGEGAPFDYIQLADMWLGTPVSAVHITRDKQWILIKGQGILGWIPSDSFAYINSKFIDEWKSSEFVIPTVQKQIINANDKHITELSIGSILPIDQGKLLVPYKSKTGIVETKLVETTGLNVKKWPLAPSYKEFSLLVQPLLNIPYGWGGSGFNSDCSGLMRRLLINFGIWIPRSSYWQANYAGSMYSMYGLSEQERKDIIINKKAPLNPYLF